MGFPVDHHIQENLGHGIDRFGLEFGNDFLKKILKHQKTPNLLYFAKDRTGFFL